LVNIKRLFLIDGLGAFVTATFLFAIQRACHKWFGMPHMALTILSLIALSLCVYSMSCFFCVNKNWRPFLKAIAIANLLYCGLTLGLVVYYYPQLTIWGIGYFLFEIAVIGLLVFFEINALNIKYS
jgi:hypothetical protein